MSLNNLLPAASFYELTRVLRILYQTGCIKLPRRLLSAALFDSGLEPLWNNQERQAEVIGDLLMECFGSLGPMYGKAGQLILSRLPAEQQVIAEKWRLTRLYQDWPPMPLKEVEAGMDKEVPGWREQLQLEPIPLGVASMAQVHGAIDRAGREWVVKILKPKAKQRLTETVTALEQVLKVVDNFSLSPGARRTSRELWELCRGLRREMDLDLERINLERMRTAVAQKRQSNLKIPGVWETFCSANILVMERFRGASLADIVRGRVRLAAEKRRILARKTLSDLLIQIFELGVFHGDPHGGNLILLEDGSIGLVDWGLTGELLDSDRKHIAAMLRAMIAIDFERLVLALVDMAETSIGIEQQNRIKERLREFGLSLKQRHASGEVLKFADILNEALTIAEQLEIRIPDGLLMMAKSLLTVEGLARGIDPQIALARIATPVLLKVARPSAKELMGMGLRLPKVAKKWLSQAPQS